MENQIGELKDTLSKVSDGDLIRIMAHLAMVGSDVQEAYDVRVVFLNMFKIVEAENDKRLRERM